MATRRARSGGARPQPLLPLTTAQASNSLYCWYCDFKIYTLNKFLFLLGRRHARILRMWFSIGVAFTFVALVGVTMILLCGLLGAFLHLYNGTLVINNLLNWLFGTFPTVNGFSMSIMDAGVMIFSTLISVSVHEFGHAVAAARSFFFSISILGATLFEGIQIEYIAIFLAVIFPGALIAFNYDLLQSLPYLAALRIYCGGIWHNIMFCGVCWLSLLLLPLISYPLYIHGEGPMVLEVPQATPLSGYLSQNDVILSVDGSHVYYPNQWVEKMHHIHNQVLHETVSHRKGYCVPNPWVELSKHTKAAADWSSCSDELAAFAHISCSNSGLLIGNNSSSVDESKPETMVCLRAKDVVKLKKCGDGWQMNGADSSICACSEEESCMAPVQIPGMSWIEISYSSPYSSECLHQGQNSRLMDTENPAESTSCGGTFVFVGDVLSLAHSVQLSAYRPRPSFAFSAWIPSMLEKILTCNFHVSLSLSLLNSLPVYFLDGESIIEMVLCSITWLSPRRRYVVLRCCLISGTILTAITFLRILYSAYAISLSF